MKDHQLSFLSSEPTAFDVNAIDDASIRPVALGAGNVGSVLSKRSVDDWVLGLGFTNWKALLDHAIQTGHYELYDSEDGCLGLRKHGYRYAPIPRLPAGGAAYIQQRLLLLAGLRNPSSGRQEKMISVTPDFAHKCVIENGFCDLTVKQGGEVIRAGMSVDEIAFGERLDDFLPLTEQLARVLVKSGAKHVPQLMQGCKSLASHIARIANGVR